MRPRICALLLLTFFCCSNYASPAQRSAQTSGQQSGQTAGSSSSDAGWPTYGGDPGGERFSPATQITRANVRSLQPLWVYHTHALDSRRSGHRSAAFEATPVLFRNTLYFTTPFDVVIALDPATGAERWRYDPQIGHLSEGSLITSRGVATWQSPSPVAGQPCQNRIFVATLNGRLAAADADTGTVCADFGDRGQINLRNNVDYKEEYEGYSLTSAPTVVGNIVIVGSSIGDNFAVDMPRGTVRGFDVVTGHLLWTWDPIPWALSQTIRTGAANAWSTIAADPVLGLIYIPTGSASPDYYGGLRPGDDRDADSVVALDAVTGRKVWAFQVIHHNLWDYDVAAEPLLFTFRNQTPAIAIAAKTGMLFVLDRRTGQPLYPIEERAVPQSDVPGEQSSPTQPFSSLPSFSPLTPPEASSSGWQRSPEDQQFCRQQMQGLRYDGIFTPPSIGGTLLYPSPLGGVNWGSMALDPSTGIIYANNNRAPYLVRVTARDAIEGSSAAPRQKIKNWLHDRWMNLLWLHNPVIWFAGAGLLLVFSMVRQRSLNPGLSIGALVVLILAIGGILEKHYLDQTESAVTAVFGRETGPNLKAPYTVLREPIVDHDGLPCTPPPFGAMTAINLNTGRKVFESPLGTMVAGQATGSISLGGPIVTAGGLIFTAAIRERYLRALDAATGQELWKGDLPVPAQSTPMTYTVGHQQFVVVAAGGHGTFGTPQGDSLIAFGLK